MAARPIRGDDGRVNDQPHSSAPPTTQLPTVPLTKGGSGTAGSPNGGSPSAGSRDAGTTPNLGTQRPGPQDAPPVADHRCTGWQSHLRGGWAMRKPGRALRRPQQGRIVGGVAGALSARTGIGPNIFRTAFVCSSLAGGFGAAVYVLAWLFIPAAGEDGNIASRALADRRGIALAAGAASLLTVVLMIAALLHVGWLGSLSWPPVVALAGIVLIWRNASREEQRLLRQVAEPILGLSPGGRRSAFWLRVILAGVLLISGAAVVFHERITARVAWPLTGVALLLIAVLLLLGPWWLRIVRDQFAERQARIRAEERAEMASRLHDSVLQTLALIQRRADDPHQVV